VRRDCPERYKKASANVAMSKSDSDSDGDVLSVSDSVHSTEAWMLDSASSFHATHKKEWFTSYKSGDFGLAYLGDDTGYRAIRVGDINTRGGVEHVLRGVRHVLGLRRNLISLGALRGDGMLFRAEPDLKTIKIMKGDETVMMGERTVSHLYKLQGCTVAGGVMADGVAGVAVFSEGGGFEVRSDSSGGSPCTTKSKPKSGVHGGSHMMASRWLIFAKVEFVGIVSNIVY
jgi:hypothetical protein